MCLHACVCVSVNVSVKWIVGVAVCVWIPQLMLNWCVCEYLGWCTIGCAYMCVVMWVFCAVCVLCCVRGRSHRILPTSSLFASTLQSAATSTLCSEYTQASGTVDGRLLCSLIERTLAAEWRRVGWWPGSSPLTGWRPARGTQNALSGSSALSLSTAPKHLFKNMEVLFAHTSLSSKCLRWQEPWTDGWRRGIF